MEEQGTSLKELGNLLIGFMLVGNLSISINLLVLIYKEGNLNKFQIPNKAKIYSVDPKES